ncbi:MAG: hypothetical protein CMLOHMNK_01839 [Steroidobacteraceae bacterium]|nr:hypothetical protein [Steroidobacteraceae bacterium]
MPEPTRTVFAPALQDAVGALNLLCLEEFTMAAALESPASPAFIREHRAIWISGSGAGRRAVSQVVPVVLIDLALFAEHLSLESQPPKESTGLQRRTTSADTFSWHQKDRLLDALSALLWRCSHAPLASASLAMGLPVVGAQTLRRTEWHSRATLESVPLPAPRWTANLTYWRLIGTGCATGSAELVSQASRWSLQLTGGRDSRKANETEGAQSARP